MQIVIRKKVISLNIFICTICLIIKTVCKILRSVTIPILSKIEITIDFNGHERQIYSSNTQKLNSDFFKLNQVIPIKIN